MFPAHSKAISSARIRSSDAMDQVPGSDRDPFHCCFLQNAQWFSHPVASPCEFDIFDLIEGPRDTVGDLPPDWLPTPWSSRRGRAGSSPGSEAAARAAEELP